MLCPQCGRAHYNPAKRRVSVRWSTRDTKLRILDGEYKGKIAWLHGVQLETVTARVNVGTYRKPVDDIVRLLPSQVRRISGGRAAFP